MKPRLLDVFCGAGGCTKGYQDAGFYVVGVDIEPQPNYCGDEFIQMDALALLESQVLETPAPLGFDAVHASPPCQAYSAITPNPGDHPELIDEVRPYLLASGLPYVIENVVGALSHMRSPQKLCGSSFGLPLQRHRYFETNFDWMAPPCAHGMLEARFDVYEHGRWYKSPFAKVYGSGGGKAMEHWAEAMDIDWMTHAEMAEAIPPAFTEHIGLALLHHIRTRRAEQERHAIDCDMDEDCNCGMTPLTRTGEGK